MGKCAWECAGVVRSEHVWVSEQIWVSVHRCEREWAGVSGIVQIWVGVSRCEWE